MTNLPCFNWAEILESLSPHFTNAPDVLRNAGIHADTLRPLYVAPKDVPYGRSVLYQSDIFEVMLANWAEGAACAPHDHSFSNGVVWLVEGEFEETHYKFANDLKVAGTKKIHSSGTFLKVTPGDIHSMVAVKGGTSLHIYSPAIQKMKVFDTEKRKVLTVSGDCGAWVPQDQTQILDETPWPKL